MSTQSRKIRLNSLIVISFLMALEIVLTRLLSINTPLLRISFGFLPIALIGIMFGPLWAAGANVLCDTMGILFFPTGFPYFFGFTLSAFLTGAVFGIFLHKREVTWYRVLPASLIVCMVINLCLNSLWLSITMGQAWLVLVPLRFVKELILIVIQTVLIPLVWKYIKRFAPVARPTSSGSSHSNASRNDDDSDPGAQTQK